MKRSSVVRAGVGIGRVGDQFQVPLGTKLCTYKKKNACGNLLIHWDETRELKILLLGASSGILFAQYTGSVA